MSKRKVLKKVTALSLCLCSIMAMSACDVLSGKFPFMNNTSTQESVEKESVEKESAGQENVKSDVTMSVSEFNAPVSLVYPAVLSYLEADAEELVTDFLPFGSERYDQGKPLTISCSFTSKSGIPDVKKITVEFSFTEDFAVIEQTDTFAGNSRDLQIFNLQTGRKYYFRVTALLGNGATLSKTGEVETAASPRMIRLSGGSNVRDIGGWKTEDGKTIKQGMLYRGGEIDGGKNKGHPDFCLDQNGIKQLRALGIKTDIDLRSESVKVGEYSVLGEDVTRNFYDAAQYQSILQSGNAERTRKIFSDLANPAAYPVYLHCTHGVDRAGSTVLILQALLGVPKEDLIRDYELSAFYYNYKHVNRNLNNGGNILTLIEGLEAYPGDTLADKTAAFLYSIGVTGEEIASLRSTLLE